MEVSSMLRREKGFTLIELLIVVAIIGIIAAIAVPNLLTAIQRSKRSRTAADLRAIGTAIESYMVDHNIYPENNLFTILEDQGYYRGSTKDGWGQTFTYTVDAEQNAYTVTSTGKDMAADGDGEFDSDITYHNGQFSGPPVLAD
jgi:general secretion pathway protein G